uniref:RRM domain-containing protein n=1 Tax=Steinernema glaseri TaxID=37863 RepID=A0A1I7YAT5_9BILA
MFSIAPEQFTFPSWYPPSPVPTMVRRSMRPPLAVVVPPIEPKTAVAVPQEPEAVAAAVSKVDNLGLAERSILVSNLLDTVTVPMLYTLFENAGPVEHVVLRLGADGKTQVAMVLFVHKPSVKFSVTAFDNCLFCGQIINVMSMNGSAPRIKEIPPPRAPPTPPSTPRLLTASASDDEIKECIDCTVCKLFRARYNGEISVDDVLDSLPSLQKTARGLSRIN